MEGVFFKDVIYILKKSHSNDIYTLLNVFDKTLVFCLLMFNKKN